MAQNAGCSGGAGGSGGGDGDRPPKKPLPQDKVGDDSEEEVDIDEVSKMMRE